MRKKAFIIAVALTVWVSSQQTKGQEMAIKTNLLYDATTTINLGYEVALNHKTTFDIRMNYNPWTLGSKWVGLHENEQTGPSASQRDTKLKHFALQPEVRRWFCEKFNGHFLGVHLHGGVFNVGAIKLPFDWGRYKDEDGKYLGVYPETMNPVGKPNTPIQGVAYKISGEAYPGLGVANGTKLETHDELWGNADKDGIYINSYEGWFIGAGVSYGYHLIMSPRFSMEFSVGVGYAYLGYDKNRCTNCKKKLDEKSTHYFGPTQASIALVYMLK